MYIGQCTMRAGYRSPDPKSQRVHQCNDEEPREGNRASNRTVIGEPFSRGVLVNELLQLEVLVRMRQQIQFGEAAFQALECCRDLVQITDPSFKIQYANKACEKVLGYAREDVVDASIHDVTKDDVVSSSSSSERIGSSAPLPEEGVSPPPASGGGLSVSLSCLKQGKDWEGSLTCRRKSGDYIPLQTRVSPIAPQNGHADHYVFVEECPVLFLDKGLLNEIYDSAYPRPPMSRGSLFSARKFSTDVRSLTSEVGRRQSIAKQHTTTVEAPIFRAVNLIHAAKENSPGHVTQALDKVLEILRSAELYSPVFSGQQSRNEDPLANDLLGGLLALHLALSNANSVGPATPMSPPHGIKNPFPYSSPLSQASVEVRGLLEKEKTWAFDVIKLEEATKKRPLFYAGMATFMRFQVHAVLNVDLKTLHNWLQMIEAHYHASNPYHNATHAADVMQAIGYFLEFPVIKEAMEPLDNAACLIAAVIHDLDHPGKNSAFLVNTRHDLAVLYNDTSVLESHHVAHAFKLTLSDPRFNIFKGLDRETFQTIRRSIIDMVLATEMTKHFEHLSKFKNAFDSTSGVSGDDADSVSNEPQGSDSDAQGENEQAVAWATTENIVLVKRMMIKCADVSNPVRPLHLCQEWGYRIAEEYFQQTEEETDRGLPIVMPLFDRRTCSIPKAQIGFIDFFITDMFMAFDAFADTPELLERLKHNYEFWKLENQRLMEAEAEQSSPL
ncbi:unnamed protein product [Notodromas monacha]|uniref:3',5'-cyclic-AMP phosphodiesterase n=1 Tax=Notodromas monacha TaxID=399045 RepID=A0A7R9G958_9CRUS|nr:unnamed protein product [Notodromas monacha]CAG0912262.1 unnamed protein product [Notodromas monacha]